MAGRCTPRERRRVGTSGARPKVGRGNPYVGWRGRTAPLIPPPAGGWRTAAPGRDSRPSTESYIEGSILHRGMPLPAHSPPAGGYLRVVSPDSFRVSPCVFVDPVGYGRPIGSAPSRLYGGTGQARALRPGTDAARVVRDGGLRDRQARPSAEGSTAGGRAGCVRPPLDGPMMLASGHT
jgi:hypothetical protein